MTQQEPQGSERSLNTDFVISKLLEVNAQLTEQLIELARTLAQHKEPVLTAPMESFHSNMHVPETEEDATFAFNTGQINKEELQDTLKEIGFYNAEITVPS